MTGKKDPMTSCDVYRKEGCAHVDGFLCDVEKCDILESYTKLPQINKVGLLDALAEYFKKFQWGPSR